MKMQSVVRRLFFDAPLRPTLARVGPLAGVAIGGLFAIAYTVPELVGWVVDFPATASGAVSMLLVALAVGAVLGAAWGFTCSLGAIAFSWFAPQRNAAPRVALVACGAAIGSVTFGLLVVAPLMEWDPVLTSVPVAALASAGLGTVAARNRTSRPTP